MNNRQILRNTLCIIFSLFAFTPALDFSKSSITAFDRSYLLGGSLLDTVTIHNSSSVKTIIDSVSFEFDSPIYTQFEIGWMGRKDGTGTIRFFESDNFTFGNECANVSENTKRGMSLSEYKHANPSEKITFQPNEKIEIFSPYFSTCRTDLGMHVWCGGLDGPCVFNLKVDQISHFNGRIIFFTGLTRDTLNLLCGKTTYTTGVQKKVIANHTLAQTNNHYEVNILGRKLLISKLDAYHSIKLQREQSIVLH